MFSNELEGIELRAVHHEAEADGLPSCSVPRLSAERTPAPGSRWSTDPSVRPRGSPHTHLIVVRTRAAARAHQHVLMYRQPTCLNLAPSLAAERTILIYPRTEGMSKAHSGRGGIGERAQHISVMHDV